mgnify:CR=1 FL=1
MSRKAPVRCEVGEKLEIISKAYLSLSVAVNFDFVDVFRPKQDLQKQLEILFVSKE